METSGDMEQTTMSVEKEVSKDESTNAAVTPAADASSSVQEEDTLAKDPEETKTPSSMPPKKRGRKPGSKNKVKGPPKKRPKKEPQDAEELSRKREELLAQEWERFQKEKEEILESVPDEYRSRFGQVAWAKFGKQWYSALILSPYDVAPGDVRESWMSMYEHTANRRKDMTYLVYYYGTLSQAEYYGFHPKSQIMWYEDGVKKGMDKLPKAMQNKIDKGKKLSKPDQLVVRGLEEMREDLAKEPQERKRGIWPFQEMFESDAYLDVMLKGQTDEVSLSDIEMESDLDDESLVDSDDDALSGDEDGSVEQETPKKKKKKKKPTAKTTKAKKKKAPEIRADDVDAMDFAEDEVSSVDKDADDELLEAPSSSEDDDEDDMDYAQVKEVTAKKIKPKTPKTPKEKPAKKKREKQEKPKLQRGRAKKKDGEKSASKKKELSDKEKRKREQKQFNANVAKFDPLGKQLKEAVKQEKSAELQDTMKAIFQDADEMTAPFIEKSGIVRLLKEQVKPFLKQHGIDKATYLELYKKLKSVHEAKKAQVPEGFQPKITKPKKSTSGAQKIKEEANKAPSSATPPPPEDSVAVKEETTKSAPEEQESQKRTVALKEETKTPSLQQSPVRSRPPQTSSQQSEGNSVFSSASTSKGSAAPKSQKKSFSLGTLIRPKTPASRDTSIESSAAKGATLGTLDRKRVVPSWLTSPPLQDDDFFTNETRVFALEDFFQGAAARFPAEKVKAESVARSLEAAVYQWSQEKFKDAWIEPYWLKAQYIVAAICGKYKTGTLMGEILDGKFESARDVVALSDDALVQSFEAN